MSSRSSSTSAERSQGDDNDLQKALNYLQQELNDLYTIVVFRNQTPLSQGFPVLRPRWYVSSLTLDMSFKAFNGIVDDVCNGLSYNVRKLAAAQFLRHWASFAVKVFQMILMGCARTSNRKSRSRTCLITSSSWI